MDNINISGSAFPPHSLSDHPQLISENKLTKLFLEIQEIGNSIKSINNLEKQIEVTYRIVNQTQVKLADTKSHYSIFNIFSRQAFKTEVKNEELIIKEMTDLLQKLRQEKSKLEKTSIKLTTDFEKKLTEALDDLNKKPSLTSEDHDFLLKLESECQDILQNIDDKVLIKVFDKIYKESLVPVLEKGKTILHEKLHLLKRQSEFSSEDVKFLLDSEKNLRAVIDREPSSDIKKMYEKDYEKTLLPILDRVKPTLNLAQRLDLLSQLNFFSSDDLEFIFRLENEIRDDPFKEPIRQTSLKLIQKAKGQIASHQGHRAATAAANIKASVGLNVIQKIAKDAKLLSDRAKSKNIVRLISGKSIQSATDQEAPQGAVVKKMDQRSKEQEKLFNELMALKTTSGLIGTFNVASGSQERFGMKWVDADMQRRMLKPEDFSAKDKDPVKRELSTKFPNIFEKGLPSKLSKENLRKLTDIQTYEKITYSTYQFFDLKIGKMRTITFDELKILSQKGVIQNHQLPIINQATKTADIKKIMERVSPNTAFLMPNLNTDKKKELYQASKNAFWNYTDDQGKTHRLPFANVYALIMGGLSTDSFTLADPEQHPKLTAHTLDLIFDFSWNALKKVLAGYIPQKIYFTPDLDTLEKKQKYAMCEKTLWVYTNEQGEAFPAPFKLMHALVLSGIPIEKFRLADPENHPAITEALIREMLDVEWTTVSPESEHPQALKNVQVKPMIEDMHLMHPLMNEGEAVINKVFQSLTVDAEEAALINGELQPIDLHANNIGFRQIQSEQMHPFNEIECLAPWGIWQKGWRNIQLAYLRGHLKGDTAIKVNGIAHQVKDLPWITEALKMPWEFVFFDNDISFGEDNELLSYTLPNGNIGHFIPFRSHILANPWKDKPLREEVIDRLLQSREGDQRQRDYLKRADAPIRKQMSTEGQYRIDAVLKPLLEQYQLHPGSDKISASTFKQLKEQFIHDVSNLSRNSDFWALVQAELPKYQLTADTPESLKQRERIAAQLFPRATLLQQKAMIERQDNRKAYLEAYQALKMAKYNQRREQINQFLTLPSLIDTFKKENLQKRMAHANDKEMNKIYQEVLRDYVPTYMNVMAVMYPHLADNYRLAAALKRTYPAALDIGTANFTIEDAIHQAEEQFSSGSDEYKLAMHLEKVIAEKVDAPTL